LGQLAPGWGFPHHSLCCIRVACFCPLLSLRNPSWCRHFGWRGERKRVHGEVTSDRGGWVAKSPTHPAGATCCSTAHCLLVADSPYSALFLPEVVPLSPPFRAPSDFSGGLVAAGAGRRSLGTPHATERYVVCVLGPARGGRAVTTTRRRCVRVLLDV